LALTGVASNRDVLRRFIALLEEEKAVSGVESPVANFLVEKDIPFTLEIDFFLHE